MKNEIINPMERYISKEETYFYGDGGVSDCDGCDDCNKPAPEKPGHTGTFICSHCGGEFSVNEQNYVDPENTICNACYAKLNNRFVCSKCGYSCPCSYESSIEEVCINCYNALPNCPVCGKKVIDYDRFSDDYDYCKTCGNAITVTVTPSSATVEEGESVSLTATVSEDQDLPVTWSTEDTNKISLSDDGTVTGLANGSATVTATIPGGASDVAYINVVPPEMFTCGICKDKHSIDDESDYECVCKDCYNALPECPVCGVKVYEQNRFSDDYDYCKTCGNAITVTVTPSSATVEEGESVSFTATVSHGQDLPVTWSAGGDKVSVSDDGTVTGISAGSATVTASIPLGASDSATVTVKPAPVQNTDFVCKKCNRTCPCSKRAYETDYCYECYSKFPTCPICQKKVIPEDRLCEESDLCKECGEKLTVSVHPENAKVTVGKTVQLTAVIPEKYVLPITWSTEDTDIISVSDDGTVTGLSAGTATVVASTADLGIQSESCVIEVIKVSDSYDAVTGKAPIYLDGTPPSEAPTNINKDAFVQDPVEAYSGAHILSNTVFALRGGQNLKIKLDYRSNRFGKGELGAGWNHNFEKRLEIDGNCAYLYEGESVYLKFERECETCSLFNCTTTGRKTYTLEEIDGVHCLNRNFDLFEYYVDGELTRIITRQGFETIILHTPTLTTITDCVSGKKVYLEKNADGRIVKIYDDAARSAIIDYHGDLLVRIIDANGKSLVYDYDSSGRVKRGYDADDTCYFENTYDSYGRVASQKDALGNPISTFVYETDGTRVTTNRNGDRSVRVFDSVGQLTSYTDENGITKIYTYDDNGNLISETDGNGNTISRTFNEFNKISRIVDKNGNATVYEYDTRGNLTRVTYPVVNGASPVETYEYNDANRLVRHVDLRGTVTMYSYDEKGLPVSKTVGTKAPVLCAYENGLKISETDAKGNTSYFEYDAAGFMTCKTDVKGSKTYYSYDKAGNPVEITDAAGKKTLLEYDSNYKPLSETDANGNKTSFIYNGNLKLTKTTYVDCSTEQYEYDGEDRPVKFIDRAGKITVTAYDKGGRVTSKTMPDGGVVRYEYDNAGRVTKETNPKGAVTTMTYDANGNVLTVKDNAGNVTTNTYDALNRLVKKTNAANNSITYTYNAAGDLIAETDAMGNSVTYTYDAYGNKLTATDRNGNTVTYTYDANNNLLTETDPLGNVKSFTYDERNLVVTAKDALDRITIYGYDVLGRRTTVTDARNNTFTNTYDAMGNVLKVIDAKGNTVSETVYNNLNLPEIVTDAVGKVTSYSYNALGKVESVTDSYGKVKTFSYDSMGRNNSVTDEMNGVSSVTYDNLGNVTKLQGPLGGATNYTYDNMGRLTAESTTSSGTVQYTYNELNLKNTLTNARGSQRTYTYDANGRIKSYTDSGNTVSFTYDNNGNILTVTDANGTITRTFDALNRVTSCTDTSGKTIGYAYNAVGDLTRITYPDSTAVNYAYDANHNLITVTDWANRVTTYTYDVNNNVTGVTKPDGSVTTTVYDDMQRVVSTVDRSANNTVITGFEYTYDDLSRIVEEKHLAEDVKICYTYDELSRVTERTARRISDDFVLSTENFVYDAAGNIYGGDADTAFEYDVNNRLTSFNGNSVNYDADGNMLSNGVSNFAYDSANRLVSADGHTYTYSAEDTRIRAVHNGLTTVYTYNTNAKLSQLLVKETNGTITKYVYGLGLIGEEVNNSFKTYHFDYRGSTVAITNVNGTVTDTFTYNTYGKLTNRTGNSDIIFCYNGRDGVITEDNGLVYMRARYYSPDMRRFINADIIPGQISNAVTLNRYAYANGNPVSNVDPFGLSAERGSSIEPFDFTSVANNPLSTLPIEDKKSILDAASEFDDIRSELSLYRQYGYHIYRRGSRAYVIGGKKAGKSSAYRQSYYDIKKISESSNVDEHWDILKNVDVRTGLKSEFNLLKPSGKLNKGALFNYAGIALNVGLGVAENIAEGTDAQKIVSDATIDVGVEIGIIALSTMIGSWVGSVVPGLGNVVGAGVGLVVGDLLDFLLNRLKYKETSVTDVVKSAADIALDYTIDFAFSDSGDLGPLIVQGAACSSMYTTSGSPMRVDKICFGDTYVLK